MVHTGSSHWQGGVDHDCWESLYMYRGDRVATAERQEFDLNPVKVLTPGEGGIAIDGRMRLAPLG